MTADSTTDPAPALAAEATEAGTKRKAEEVEGLVDEAKK